MSLPRRRGRCYGEPVASNLLVVTGVLVPGDRHTPGPVDLGHLKTADWQRLQDLLDPFEEAWHAADGPGSAVELERFLPPPGDALRLVALHELVKADLEFRWRHAQPALLESYLDRFPELGPARSLDARVVYEEYRVRRRHGGHPTLSES